MTRRAATGMNQVRPPSAEEHVLGQIERGEVRAGPDAAREIAARHQAAYGDAVWGPAPSAGTPLGETAGEQDPR